MPKCSVFLLVLFSMVIWRGKLKSQNTVPQHANAKEKIGWIPFDSQCDRADFTVCDELNIEEYYQVNPRYHEGMYSIRRYFEPHKQELNGLCEKDGYIIVRFVINCQGETDRYRSRFLALNYTEHPDINQKLAERLKVLVHGMGLWQPGEYQGKRYDAYQQIKFLFKGNQLTDILF